MKLTEASVKNARPGDKPKKLTNGDRLFLFGSPAGGKLRWLVCRLTANKNFSASGPILPLLTRGKYCVS